MIDFITFLSALVSYDDFIEYWKDIFYRYNANICHYSDIDNLMTRINKVRVQIRKAFFTCGNTGQLKDTYYELEAELYYLRKYIDAGNGNFKVANDTKVYNDLRGYFVLNKSWLTKDKAKKLFDSFKEKYSTKLTTYRECKDPGLQALVDKWNEFKANLGGIGPAMKQASDSITKNWNRMKNTPFGSGISAEFSVGFSDLRQNQIPPRQDFQQTADELTKDPSAGPPTYDQLLVAQSVKNVSYNYNFQQANYLATYQQLYYETADQFSNDISSILDTLKQIIQSSFRYQNQTIQCVGSLNKKQC